MFLIPVSELESSLILALLFIWAALLFGGFLFGRTSADRKQRIPVWARIASSFTLVILGWIIFIVSQGTMLQQMTLWIALGMSFGFLGDMFMANIMPVKPSVLYGMAAFGLGHIAYMIGMGFAGTLLQATVPVLSVLLLWWAVAVAGWYIVVFRGAQRTLLHYAALPYALLLASTAGFATSLALLNTLFIPMAVGAALFLLSDLILAGELFSGLSFPLISDVIWLTYGPGQMLIVLGSTLLTILGATG